MLIKRKLILIGLGLVTATISIAVLQQHFLGTVTNSQYMRWMIAQSETKMLTLRRHEKDFLARKDLAYEQKFAESYRGLVDDLTNIQPNYLSFVGDDEDIKQLLSVFASYKERFDEVVTTTKRIGLTPEDGLYGNLRKSVHEAESRIIAQNSDTMMRHMLMLRRHEKDFMLRHDEKYIEKFESSFDVFMQALNTRNWPSAARSEVRTLMDAYRRDVLALVAAEKKLGLNPNEGLFGAMRATIHQSETTFKSISEKISTKIDRRIFINQVLQIGSSVVMLLLIFATLYFVARRSVKALEKIAVGMTKTFEQKDLSVRIDVSGKDEFATMANVFNQMLAEFEVIIKRLTASSATLSATANDLTVATERTNQGVTKQHNESDQVATAMNEMAATVQEVARNAAEAAHVSAAASDHATRGKSVVTKASEGLRSLANEVNNTAKAITQLEKESNNIGTVLSVIQGIAEQTNLLALNAAIEAARAGETGRGFAVVADEVRTLAQRSKDATEEIKSIIDRLQTVARSAVRAMEAGLKQSDVAVEQANAAGVSLEQIAGAVTQINEMNSQIAAAAEEQTTAADTVNESVATIAQISEETAEMAQKTLDTGTKLAQIAMDVHQIVGLFKLSGQTLDLSKAKSAHLAWKAKLRSFLDGKQALTLQEAVSHKHCVLGKWYYGEGLEKFGHVRAMRDLENPHAEMHGLIKTIIELQQAGNRQEAEETYKKVAPLSEQIVSLLDSVENTVNADYKKKSA